MTVTYTKSLEVLEDQFNHQTLQRGKKLWQEGNVLSLQLQLQDNREYKTYQARVLGSGKKTYSVSIEFIHDNDLFSRCSCPVEIQCKHGAAVALELLETRLQDTSIDMTLLDNSSSDIDSWLNNFLNGLKPAATTITSLPQNNNPKKKKEIIEHLLFELSPAIYHKTGLQVQMHVSRCLVKGGYGKPKSFRPSNISHRKSMQPIDHNIFAQLQRLNMDTLNYSSAHYEIYISEKAGADIVQQILDTGRCFWENTPNTLLERGPTQQVYIEWELTHSGEQHPVFLIQHEDLTTTKIDNQTYIMVYFGSPWYIDKTQGLMGELTSELPVAALHQLSQLPPLQPELVQTFNQRLSQIVTTPIPLPLEIKINKEVVHVEPSPLLELDIVDIKTNFMYPSQFQKALIGYGHEIIHSMTGSYFTVAMARIKFNYDGELIELAAHQHESEPPFIHLYKNGALTRIHRNLDKEQHYIEQLCHLTTAIFSFGDESVRTHNNTVSSIMPDNTVYFPELVDEEDYVSFSAEDIPILEANGWQVTRHHEAFFNIINDEDLEWYSDLKDESEYDYFGIHMGIIIDGEKVNILPLVLEQMDQFNPTQIKQNSRSTNERLLSLPDGNKLNVSEERIKPILNLLYELYNTELNEDGSLQVSKNKASLLYEIQKAFHATTLRWFGGDKLRKLAQQLSDFQTPEPVKLPSTFKANLRSYQEDGVSWLQFLRAHGLGGILADDMGLGKTVQTLAHLSIEKNKGRLKKPCLILAPTSLMPNWSLESAKMLPSLKTLVFHGDNRHIDKNDFSQYHVVFTTYPLILRDKNLFLKQDWYYLILDEAQFIKNAKAKSTQIVQQLTAEHRLCLTGTPMENHLGELWSLFHFLMPGFLGNSKTFNQLYRAPIERKADETARQALAVRINPFILRRLKQNVLNELPDKTEILETIELLPKQGDLYESIRLAMEKKVRDAIAAKGVARSHIIVLDALLKLRQTCCDPRLLKLASAQTAHGASAKIEWLKEMLPNMVLEGRKILIFSQFTKMLAIIEETINALGLSSVKLTGSTKNRQKPIESFQQGEVPIFLISLKAGGTGLNLTAADTVIHYDPWWNPAVENQATDRAHRMGQQRAVFVYKLQAAGTVEETIQDMQQKKKHLMEGLFSEEGSSKFKLTQEEITGLFEPVLNDS